MKYCEEDETENDGVIELLTVVMPTENHAKEYELGSPNNAKEVLIVDIDSRATERTSPGLMYLAMSRGITIGDENEKGSPNTTIERATDTQ